MSRTSQPGDCSWNWWLRAISGMHRSQGGIAKLQSVGLSVGARRKSPALRPDQESILVTLKGSIEGNWNEAG